MVLPLAQAGQIHADGCLYEAKGESGPVDGPPCFHHPRRGPELYRPAVSANVAEIPGDFSTTPHPVEGPHGSWQPTALGEIWPPSLCLDRAVLAFELRACMLGYHVGLGVEVVLALGGHDGGDGPLVKANGPQDALHLVLGPPIACAIGGGNMNMHRASSRELKITKRVQDVEDLGDLVLPPGS